MSNDLAQYTKPPPRRVRAKLLVIVFPPKISFSFLPNQSDDIKAGLSRKSKYFPIFCETNFVSLLWPISPLLIGPNLHTAVH